MTKMSGAQALLESLERQKVDTIFGILGGAILPVYDALCGNKKIRHILARHEQCAAHEAEGYAKASGRVGVCMATSGPGATNLVTGIADAYMDSVPIVALTGQVPISRRQHKLHDWQRRIPRSRHHRHRHRRHQIQLPTPKHQLKSQAWSTTPST